MARWDPHSYHRKGIQLGYGEAYLAPLIADANLIKDKDAEPLFTIAHLAANCGVKYRFLHKVISRTVDPYRNFYVKKRSGGRRTICAPWPGILEAQRWINQNILAHQIPHPGSTAYAKGCSPFKNAQRHCGEGNWLIKVDIKNFFESVSEYRVYHYFRSLNFRPVLAFELARICTRVSGDVGPRIKTYPHYQHRFIGYLPQGAPTSPMLANLIFTTMDQDLHGLAREINGNYSRYSDDIVISSPNLDRPRAEALLARVLKKISEHGLTPNMKKVVIVPKGTRKIVTGLNVQSVTPKLNKEFRDKIRQHLYYARTRGIAEHCKTRGFRSVVGFHNHLEGLINYASSVEPNFGEAARTEFQALNWAFYMGP